MWTELIIFFYQWVKNQFLPDIQTFRAVAVALLWRGLERPG